MRAMRRLAAAALLAAALLVPLPASAQDPARLRVVSPAAEATVEGDEVRVVVAAEGGTGPATFTVQVDGKLLDATGRVAGGSPVLSVAPGERVTLDVPVSPGRHALVVTPSDWASVPGSGPVTVSFTAVEDDGAPVGMVLVVMLVAVVVIGGMLAVAWRLGPKKG